MHIKTKLKNRFFTKEKNKAQNKTRIKYAKYQQKIHENCYIDK